jgi:hypothetical protein
MAAFYAGRIVRRESRATDAEGGRDWMLAQIREIAGAWLRDFPIECCGIGFGGPVDFAAQRVMLSTHVGGWRDFDLPAFVRDLTNAAIVMDNDANVGAIGEAEFGAGKGCSPILYVTMSTGIGGGIYSNGEVWRGADSMGGEIGHLTIRPDGPECLCGARGCFERMCCGLWLQRDYGKSARDLMLEPDFGAAIAFMALTVIQLFAAGVKVLHLGAVGLAGVPAFVYLAMSEPYRMRRLLAFINPWADPLNTGYQTIQSLLAIGSGGIFGLGLGQSRQKFAYLPENHTDFIFAILAEELGLLGTIFVLFLIFVFAWRGLRIAISAPDYFGSVLAVGVTSLIIFQALLNIAVISGSLPITGLTLPLISYGGSSLAITMAGVGILLNISKYSSPR